MNFPPMAARHVRAVLALALFTGLACAGSRPEPEASLSTRRAVHEALEELPGTVLSDRAFAASGVVHITLAAPDDDRARSALRRAFAVVDSIDKLISPHLPGSEISRINAAAGRDAVRVSPWTEQMVAIALEWAERTNGAFDPTVGPMVTAWGFGTDDVAIPTPERLEAARRLVGWRKVGFDPRTHTVYLSEPGMELDLRALGKGFALDRMREEILDAGATSAIADYDGDLMFCGPGPVGTGVWPIDVADPYDPTRAFARLELPGGGFSTSYYYERAVEIEGKRYGHLIDPRTGRPASGVAGVGVYAAQQAVLNDVLSSALFIMGLQEGLRLAEELHDIEAIFVADAEPGETNEVEMTAGLRRYFKELRPTRRPIPPEVD